MRTIPKERILRVNSPGYGVEANFNLGSAKPLNQYSAIIVNPISIAHLFDKDPEVVRQINRALEEGKTAYKVEDDLLLRNIAAEAESRILELSDFLTQGGILVYFLARPFSLESNTLAVDNYYWLETLAPDQPIEQNVRHMSAVAQGRLVEVTEKGTTSEFSQYLNQQGIEWTTIIRDELLTDGYIQLATAGSNKCIAGQLFIMQSNGRVAFLPAPFSPDFDKTLIECLNIWYRGKEPSKEELAAEEKEKQEQEALQAVQVEQPESGPQFFEADQGEALAVPDSASPVSNEDTIETPDGPDKPKTQEIDLSIFSQTARQLVQKSNQTGETTESTTTPLESAQPQSPAGLDTSAELPAVGAPLSAPEISPEFSTTDAVDSTIAGKITDDLMKESLQVDPPPGQAPLATPPPGAPQETANTISQPTADGDQTVTNNDNQQDQERKQKAMEALRELQQSHPQAAPPTPTPPGMATPPAQQPAQQPAAPATQPQAQPQAQGQDPASKPLLNTLFKKDAPPAQAPQQAASPQSAPPAQPQQMPQTQPASAPAVGQPAQKPASKPMPANLPVPEWCVKFSFSYLDDLKQEQNTLSEQLASVQAKLNTVESKISSVEQLKQALLAGEPGVLLDACNTVLSRLGWNVTKSQSVANEILLANVDQPEALARIVRSDEQCSRTEVAQLAESAIAFWDEHEIEPKGILIACTWASVDPSGRSQPDFSDSLRKFAEKKNLCLLTAIQVLGIYRDMELGSSTEDTIRKQILETNGQLKGFEIEKGVVGAAV